MQGFTGAGLSCPLLQLLLLLTVLLAACSPCRGLDLLSPSLESDLPSLPAGFGPRPGGETAPLRLAEPINACDVLTNNMTGAIALVFWGGETERGQPVSCRHTDRVKRCQDAGALGVVMMSPDQQGRSLDTVPMQPSLWRLPRTDIVIPSVTVASGIAQHTLLPAVRQSNATHEAVLRISVSDAEMMASGGFQLLRITYGLLNLITSAACLISLVWWRRRLAGEWIAIRYMALLTGWLTSLLSTLSHFGDFWHCVGWTPTVYQWNILQSGTISGTLMILNLLTIYFTELWLNACRSQLLFIDKLAPVLAVSVLFLLVLEAIKYALFIMVDHITGWWWSNLWMALIQAFGWTPLLARALLGIYRNLQMSLDYGQRGVTPRFRRLIHVSLVAIFMGFFGTLAAAAWNFTPLLFGAGTFVYYLILWDSVMWFAPTWVLVLFYPQPSLVASTRGRSHSNVSSNRDRYRRNLEYGVYQREKSSSGVLPQNSSSTAVVFNPTPDNRSSDAPLPQLQDDGADGVVPSMSSKGLMGQGATCNDDVSGPGLHVPDEA